MKRPHPLIYLLGHSRSGSTVLSMHLGLQAPVFYAGEFKKFNESFKDRTCTCGLAAASCPFWGKIIEEEVSYFSRAIDKDVGIFLVSKSLSALFFGVGKKRIEMESGFYQRMSQRISEIHPEAKYILDSSKSLNRLIMYKSMKNLEIKTIYMERDLRANIASFVKRGEGLITSYFRLKVNKALMKWYMKRYKVNAVKVTLEEFISSPDDTIRKITDHLGIPFEAENHRITPPLHLISGNRKTRFASTSSNFQIDKEVNQQDPFTPRQKRILKWLGV